MNGKINTNYHDSEMPKKGCHCVCLPVISLDYVFKSVKNYDPQVFLEGYEYFVKVKIMGEFINDELEISSKQSDEYDESDVDHDNKPGKNTLPNLQHLK